MYVHTYVFVKIISGQRCHEFERSKKGYIRGLRGRKEKGRKLLNYIII